MRIIKKYCFLAFASVQISAASAQYLQYKEHTAFDSLIEICNKGFTDSAENILEHRFLIQYPDYAEGWNLLGNIRLHAGNLAAAKDAYHTAILKNPRYASAYNGMATILKRNRSYDSAFLFYKMAIALNNHFAEAYNNIAINELLRGHYTLALHYAQSAYYEKSYYAGILATLALCYYYTGDLKDCNTFLDKAKSFDYPEEKLEQLQSIIDKHLPYGESVSEGQEEIRPGTGTQEKKNPETQ